MQRKIDYSVRRLDLDQMIRNREFDGYISDRLGNDLFLSDPERANRLQEHAETGSDGSTHGETINDWREFLDTVRRLPGKVRDRIRKEIDDCEEYHNKAGTLYQVIG